MKTEAFIRVLAGTFVLLSIVLVLTLSPWWLLLTAFVGINLIQSAFTGICPPTWLLHRLGWIRADGTIAWGGQHGQPAH